MGKYIRLCICGIILSANSLSGQLLEKVAFFTVSLENLQKFIGASHPTPPPPPPPPPGGGRIPPPRPRQEQEEKLEMPTELLT